MKFNNNSGNDEKKDKPSLCQNIKTRIKDIFKSKLTILIAWLYFSFLIIEIIFSLYGVLKLHEFRDKLLYNIIITYIFFLFAIIYPMSTDLSMSNKYLLFPFVPCSLQFFFKYGKSADTNYLIIVILSFSLLLIGMLFIRYYSIRLFKMFMLIWLFGLMLPFYVIENFSTSAVIDIITFWYICKYFSLGIGLIIFIIINIFEQENKGKI